MSQEKNNNQESFQNSRKEQRKSHFFSLMTYLSEKQLRKVIKEHVRSVRAWAYIVHDQDEAEPHIHLLIRTYSTWTCGQLSKWFGGFTEKKKVQKEDGSEAIETCAINTFCEVANSPDALEIYLTHSDEESKAKGKHEYSRELIHDFGLWEIKPRKDSYDDSYEIINKVITGYSYRQLVREYGRAFVYHWEKYADLAAEIKQEEGQCKARMLSFMELTDHVENAKVNHNGVEQDEEK